MTTDKLANALIALLEPVKPDASITVVDARAQADIDLPTIAIDVGEPERHSLAIPGVMKCPVEITLRAHSGDGVTRDTLKTWADTIEKAINGTSTTFSFGHVLISAGTYAIEADRSKQQVLGGGGCDSEPINAIRFYGASSTNALVDWDTDLTYNAPPESFLEKQKDIYYVINNETLPPDCDTYSDYLSCYLDGGVEWNERCYWDWVSSTCAVYGTSTSASTECGTGDHCVYCDNVEDCEANGCFYNYYKFWTEYKCQYMGEPIEWGTTTPSTATDDSALEQFYSIYISPDNWFRDRVVQLNPLNHAPFSWIKQFVGIWTQQISMLENDELTATEFGTSTIGYFEYTFPFDTTSTKIDFLDFEGTIADGEYSAWFSSMRDIIGWLMTLAFCFTIWRIGQSWVRKHSQTT